MTTILGTFTTRSLAQSAARRGAMSAFDLRGNTLAQYNLYRTPEAADLDAIRNDWRSLGADLREQLRTRR